MNGLYELTIGADLNALFGYVFHHEESCMIEDMCETWTLHNIDDDDFNITFEILVESSWDNEPIHSTTVEVLLEHGYREVE